MGVTVRRTGPRLDEINLTNREVMREIGLLARERIIRRTAAGQDSRGAAFQPYSAAYSARKSKEGLGGGNVTLQVSGGMLRNIQIIEITDNKVVLGWVT